MPAHSRNKFSGQLAGLSATGAQGNLWLLGAFTKDTVLVESQRAHPGTPRNVVIPRLRRDPTESQYIHCLQRGGRAALIQTQLLGSPLPKGRGGARAIRPEQAKQQKRREDYLTF